MGVIVRKLIALFLGLYCTHAVAVDFSTHSLGVWSIESTPNMQRWIVINNIDKTSSEVIYHIEVLGRKSGEPAWKITHLVAHMAITEAALQRSVLKPLNKGAVYPETYQTAYHHWLEKTKGELGSVCDKTVVTCLP